MTEIQTIHPKEGTELITVLTYCDIWKENKHYPHNTPEIIDYLVEACRELMENQRQLEAKVGL